MHEHAPQSPLDPLDELISPPELLEDVLPELLLISPPELLEDDSPELLEEAPLDEELEPLDELDGHTW